MKQVNPKCIQWVPKPRYSQIGKIKRLIRTTAGLCVHCPNPPEAGKRLCDRCGSRKRLAWEARKAAGVCARCCDRLPRPDKRLCEPCSQARKDYLVSRAARGICIFCGNPRAEGKRACEHCLHRNVKHILTKRKQWASEKKCHDCGGKRRRGGKLCQPCQDAKNAASMRYYYKHRDKVLGKSKAKREARKQ